MSPSDSPPRRRTQAERRQTTVAALVEAAIEAVADLGYFGATVSQVCSRAGVSQGALFRHFPTRRHLLVEAADVVSRRLTAQFTDRLRLTTLGADTAEGYLEVLRELVRSRDNTVWQQLLESARFDPEMRALLEPALGTHRARIAAMGRATLGEDVEPAGLALALYVAVNFLDGETRLVHLTPDDPLAERSLEVLARLLVDLARPA